MRALQRQLVGSKYRKAFQRERIHLRQTFGLIQQLQTLGLIELQVFPELGDIGIIEAVRRELLLFRQPHLAISHRAAGVRLHRPHNVVDGIDILQKAGDSLETIGNLAADRIRDPCRRTAENR